MATYETVERIFGEVYGELCDVNGEDAPNSYTWFAPTMEALTEQQPAGRFDPVRSPDRRIGRGEPVAYVWECSGNTLAAIAADATEDDIREEFRTDMGFDD